MVHDLLRYVHIAAGFVGLVAFWIPVVAAKGGRVHRRAGRVFTWSLYVVASSALVSAAWALASPLTWARVAPGVPAERLPEIVARVRELGGFLGMLALLVFAAVRLGLRAPLLKTDPAALRTKELAAWHGATAVGGALLVVYAAISANVLFAVFGVLGLVSGWEFRQAWRNPLPTRMAWWYHHMNAMLGCGIAFHTAFLVFGFNRLIGSAFDSAFALLAWLAPSLIGVPAIHLWTRAYARRFGEYPAPPRREPAAWTESSIVNRQSSMD